MLGRGMKCGLECATTPPVRDDSATSHLMSIEARTGIECATTPLVRNDSARSHLMSAQLGRAETGGEVLNFCGSNELALLP